VRSARVGAQNDDNFSRSLPASPPKKGKPAPGLSKLRHENKAKKAEDKEEEEESGQVLRSGRRARRKDRPRSAPSSPRLSRPTQFEVKTTNGDIVGSSDTGFESAMAVQSDGDIGPEEEEENEEYGEIVKEEAA